VIDMASTEGRDPFEDYQTINEELAKYDDKLKHKPQIIAANKMDMPEAEEHLVIFKKQLPDDVHVYPISTLTTSGLRELLFAIANMLDTIPKIPSLFSDVEDKVIYKHEKVETPFHITRASDGAYILSGEIGRAHV